MSSDTSTSQLSFRAWYARRLVREKIYRELAIGFQPGRGFSSIPQGPYDLPPRSENDKGRRGPPDPKFCIVGAGVAGLFLAMILSEHGIKYDLLEASDRVGGRMYTKTFPETLETPHNYYDIGAMRYPDIPPMKKTFKLFEYLKIPLIPYYLDGVKCPAMYNDILGPPISPDDPDHYKVSVKNGGVVPNTIVEAGVTKILDQAFGPYKTAIKDDFEKGFKKLMEVDMFSTREYLRSNFVFEGKTGLDFHTIQWLETNNTSSGLFDQSFTESVLDSLDFDYGGSDGDPAKWFCIDGGTIKVTEAMLNEIKPQQPETNTTVKRIALERGEDNGLETKVIVELVGPSGCSEIREYDTVFNTTTLACAQRMDLTGAELHPAQKDALRVLHYDASSKVAIQFKTPWWINKCDITQGGAASSDLPLRTCVYPSYNINDPHDKPAVLLASYTWAQDAQRIASIIERDSPKGEDTLKELLLRDLARLHEGSGITYKFLCDQYITHHAFDWYHDPYTSGAFALFGPGQFSNLYPFLSRPTADSKLYFVGEATSVHHAWIVGALNSAQRAVMYAMRRFGMETAVEETLDKWGEVEEAELGDEGTAHLQLTLGRLLPKEFIRV